MTRETALSHVAEVLGGIAPEADLAAVPAGAVLREELDLDSMDLLSLYQGLHRATGVEIPEADYPRLTSLDGLLGYLVEKSA